MSEPMILTNHTGHDRSQTWRRSSFMPEFERVSSIRTLDNFYKAFRLFRLRKSYRSVVLGGGAQYDLFYMLLQRIWPFQSRPIIKMDCLWYRSPQPLHFCKKMLFKWLDPVVTHYLVWCRREVDAYAATFGLPKNKFIFIPYHTTNVETFEIKNGGYVFSGGNYARDYQTLVDSVRGLELPVVIACTNARAVEHIDLPGNVSLVSVGHREFMQLMAESSINIVSLDTSLLHSGGQQTFLNAMAMGKPVIVNDPQGAADYIENGVDGILVTAQDPPALRSALLALVDDPDYAARVGVGAWKKARQLDTEKHLAEITAVALNESIRSEANLGATV